MRAVSYLKSVPYILLFLVCIAGSLSAEGTRQLSPTADDEVLLHTNNTTFGNFAAFNGPEVSRLYVRIDDYNTEVLYIGLSAEADDNGILPTAPPTGASYQFRIVAPDGTVAHGPFTINVGNSNCPTWDLAMTGPDALFAGGYSVAQAYATFDPSATMQNGDYRIEFMDIPPSGVNVKWFDFTVAKNGTEEQGRLWSFNWVLRTPQIGVVPPECGWDRPFNGIFYTYTAEGFVSAVNFANSGFQGLTFIVAFGESGPGTSGDVLEDRKSVNEGSAQQIGDAADHMVFVSEPDIDLFTTPDTLCGTVDFLDFYCDTGGYCLYIGVNRPGLVEVILDFSGNNGMYDPGTADVLLAELVPEADTMCVYWDGLKGDGSMLSFSEPVPALVRYSQGIQHYSAYDVEYLYDGFCTETIRPICNGMSNFLYWDDSNIIDDPETPFVDESDPGTGQPVIQLNGCVCQTGGCRTWDNYQLGANPETCEGEPAGYGNERILNTWWYAVSTTLGPFDLPVVRARITGDTLVCMGESTEFTVNTNPDSLSYTYTWSGPGGFSANTQSTGPVFEAGFYYVTIVDPETTCDAVDSIEFIVSPVIETMIDFVCIEVNGPNADVDLMVAGGIEPYSFLWSNGEMTEDLFNVPPGMYTVTVTDANDCTATDMVVVEECCTLEVDCSGLEDTILDCIEDLPASDTTLIDVLGFCNSVSIESSDLSNGGAGCVGDTLFVTRTYTITDGLGNSASCVQLFTVVDNILPVVNCPVDITVECNEPTDPASTGFATANDNCAGMPVIGFSDQLSTGACAHEMVITRTWTATDICGNIGSCIQTIGIVDTGAPMIMCPPDVTIEVEESTDPGNTGSATATDNCDSTPGIDFTDEFVPGDCAQEMTLNRTWTATDACGNTSSCLQIITIGDTQAPVISCPPDVTIQCDDSSDPTNTGMASATDNGDLDPFIDFSDEIIPGACAQEALIIRTWSATDDCGNESECVQEIQIVDGEAPTINCPIDVTISCTESTLPANTGAASANDNCDNPIVVFNDVIIPSTICPQEMVIQRTWSVTDDCGNGTSCLQVITIVDDTAPELNCPPDVTINCDESADPDNTGSADATDDCDQNPIVGFSDGTTPGSCPQEMTITRIWTATDACGNATSCEQVITVVDDQAPTIEPGTCPADITISCDDPNTDFGEPAYSDNCGMVTLEIEEVLIGFVPPSSEGQIIRTFILTDECGNVNSSCVQTITVVDEGNPFIDCPADITIECGASTDTMATGVPQYSDNCGDGADLELEFADENIGFGDDCGDAIINRTFTISDPDGNSSECTQVITIEDTTPPTFDVPGDITVECDTDLDDLAILGDVSNILDCSEIDEVSYSDELVVPGCDGTGQIERTWLVFDACGNVSTDVQIIVIEDTTPPIVMSPEDITITCEDNPQDTALTGSMAVVSDACSAEFIITYSDNANGLSQCNGTGQLIRTWTAEDECGNTSQEIQVITVIDDEPPVVMCQDITLNYDSTMVITISPDTVDTGSFDNCGEVNLSLSQYTFDCIQFREIQTQTFVMYATDACGNQSSCLFTITGEGGSGILFDCPQDITLNLDPGDCEIYYNYHIEAERRCGTEDPILEQIDNSGFTSGDAFPIGVTEQEYVAYNSLGDTVFCSFTITVVGFEQTIFTMACNDQVNIGMDADCEARLNPDMILEGDHYGCYNDFFIEVSNGVSGYYSVLLTNDNIDIGNTYTVTITDNKTGYSCWSTILVEDKMPPVVNCMDVTILCNSPLDPVYTIPNQDYLPYAPMVLDNCSDNLYYQYEDQFFQSPCGLDSILRSWVISDASGNSTQCIQRIVVQLATLDDIEFPETYQGTCFGSSHPNITGYPTLGGEPLGANQYCNIWTWYDDLVLDACGGGQKIVRKWTVLDGCIQEHSSYSQVIKLTDAEPPVLTCPSDRVYGTDPWYCHTDIALLPPESYDACGSDLVFYPVVPPGVGTLVPNGPGYQWRDVPVGIYEVTWEATDACDNVGTCTYTVTIVDDKAPTAVCDEHTVVSLTEDMHVPFGLTKIYAETFDDGSFDNCSPVTFTARRMDSCIDFDWIGPDGEYPDNDGGTPESIDRGLTFQPWVPFSCCDVGNTIMVEFRVTDEAGNINSCMVEVEVTDKLTPDITCPPDVIVSCDYWFAAEETNGFVVQEDDPLISIFGRVLDANDYVESERELISINDPGNTELSQPHIWGIEGWANDNCDLDIDVRVRIFDDCSGNDLPNNSQFPKPPHAVRLIERTFRAADPSGNVSTCRQFIWVVDYRPFYISDNTCVNADPNDGVRWPCDLELNTCPSGDLSPEALDSEPILNDDNCSTVGVTYEDDVFLFTDSACIKILRTWTVVDWCQFDQATGAGLWEYLQIIKIIDTEAPEFLNCPVEPQTYCVNDVNVELPDNNQVFLGENNPDATSCSVHIRLEHAVLETCSDGINYDVKVYPFNGTEYIQVVPSTELELDQDSVTLLFDTKTCAIQSIRENGLPYNNDYCDEGYYHRILWSVEDGCGNVTSCEHLFRLEDCKQPSPVCIGGLSTVVMPGNGEVTIWATDYDASSNDDCTVSSELEFSFDGEAYQPGYTFTCQDLVDNGGPVFLMDVWVADAGFDADCDGIIEWTERNRDYCTVTIVVMDNENVCDGDSAGIAGTIMTEDFITVRDVEVSLVSPGESFAGFMTEAEGYYYFFSLPTDKDYEVAPRRNDNHRNGVSTLDLIYIQRHMLGIQPLDGPYKLIAADANNSGTVTTVDLLEIRKLILGTINEFPNNQSWRFVPLGYDFTDPFSPWPYDETIILPHFDGMAVHSDFIGIKVGDVNNSTAANLQNVAVRSGSQELHLEIPEITAGDGNTEVPVTMSENGLAGLQFTMHTGAMKVLSVHPGQLDIAPENISIEENQFTLSWNDIKLRELRPDEPVFTIILSGESGLKVSDELSLVDGIMSNEGYLDVIAGPDQVANLTLEVVPVSGDPDPVGSEFALYQNEPNPWHDETRIGFEVPGPMHVTFSVFDVTGKLLLSRSKDVQGGYSEFILRVNDLPGSSILYYKLEAVEQDTTPESEASTYSAVKKMILVR